ncbi:MAG TPA: FAD-binding protein, partial [Neisseria sp.]|nr:FAD-binding protein [Neisseria sp.]
MLIMLCICMACAASAAKKKSAEAAAAAWLSDGLTAAAQAAENGAKVIVVEKMPIVGGNSLKA